MPDLTVNSVVDNFMQATSLSDMRAACGLRTIETGFFIGAAEMIPRTTSGCGVNSSETSSFVNYDTLDFDAVSGEFANVWRIMPTNYDGGAIYGKIHCLTDNGTGNVVWKLAARSYGDGDQISGSVGTAQSVTLSIPTSGSVRVSSATPAITIAGTPSASKLTMFEIYRDAPAAGDTLAVDARLLGLEVLYSLNP